VDSCGNVRGRTRRAPDGTTSARRRSAEPSLCVRQEAVHVRLPSSGPVPSVLPRRRRCRSLPSADFPDLVDRVIRSGDPSANPRPARGRVGAPAALTLWRRGRVGRGSRKLRITPNARGEKYAPTRKSTTDRSRIATERDGDEHVYPRRAAPDARSAFTPFVSRCRVSAVGAAQKPRGRRQTWTGNVPVATGDVTSHRRREN